MSVITKKTGEVREHIQFAVLSGREAVPFDVWDNDRMFEKVKGLKDGEKICVVFGCGVDDRGKLRLYFNNYELCPDGLDKQFKELFKPVSAGKP